MQPLPFDAALAHLCLQRTNIQSLDSLAYVIATPVKTPLSTFHYDLVRPLLR